MLLGASLASVVLVACGGAAPAPQVPSSAPGTGTAAQDLAPGVSVEIRQSRSDQADRVVQLRVRAPDAGEVVVASAALDVEGFAGTAVLEAWDRRVPAGRTRDASVRLGDAVCAIDAGTPRVTLVLADEPDVEVRPEVTDPQGHLARIHAEDCAREELTAALDVEVAEALPTVAGEEGLVATLELTVSPVPGAPEVVLERVDGTVLLGPAGGGSAWTAPPLGTVVEAPTTIELALVPTRCDAHAVAEDKRGTYLGLRAVVGGRTLPTVPLDVGEELRGELRAFVGAHCGW